jgi:uncharacterized protein with HEPN domain
MPSEESLWKIRVRHILDAIAECQRFVAALDYEQFRTDAKTNKAVVWNLITIGEAAGQVPETVRQTHQQVPWRQIRGMRNRIVHGYDTVDLEVVWKAVRDELPPLVPTLERILRETPE